MDYSLSMLDIIKTDTFERWLLGLNDQRARWRIQARIDRFSAGNPGDVRFLRDGVSELRIDYGPGYRLYFMRQGPVVIVLLAGGDKSTQAADIGRAMALAKEWQEES